MRCISLKIGPLGRADGPNYTLTKIPFMYSWEFRGLSPNFHIHVSVSDLYIPRIGFDIWLQQNRQTDPGIYKSLTGI
jgi:hypothetical protein